MKEILRQAVWGWYSGSMVPQGPRLLLSFYSSILLSMLFPSAATSWSKMAADTPAITSMLQKGEGSKNKKAFLSSHYLWRHPEWLSQQFLLAFHWPELSLREGWGKQSNSWLHYYAIRVLLVRNKGRLGVNWATGNLYHVTTMNVSALPFY